MAHYVDGCLYVDNTTLSTLATCPTKAMVRYGYNLRPKNWEKPAIEAGLAIHQAIERHYTGGSLYEVMGVFENAYKDWAVRHVSIDDRLSFLNVSECVQSWVLRNPVDTLPYTIPRDDHIEMPFDFQLHPDDPTIRYVGRIDALVGRKNAQRLGQMHGKFSQKDYNWHDALYVLDTKSSGQITDFWSRQFDLSPQMTGYVWAAQNLFPEEVVAGFYINAVHVYQIPRQSGKCRQHGTDYSECRLNHPRHRLIGPKLRTRADIEEWRVDAYNLARQWKTMLDQQSDDWNLDYVPQWGKWVYQACQLCELNDFCRKQRNLEECEWEVEEWIPGDLATR